MADEDQAPANHSQNCRNRQSPYLGKDEQPPCIVHPTGTLKYELHYAYDHIDHKTENRKQVTPILIRGAFQRNIYNKMSESLLDEFNNNMEAYIVDDIAADENAEAFDAAKAVLVSCVGEAIGNRNFEMDDEPQYMDIAIRTFICDTHIIWLKRLENARKAPTTRANHGKRSQLDAVKSNDDDIQMTSVRSKRPKTRYPPARLPSVIEFDAPVINNPEVGASLSHLEALSVEFSNAVTAHSDILQTEVADLEARVAELEAQNSRLQSSNNLLRMRASGVEAELNQMSLDVATLGAALCERSNIRRNSQVAILNELPLMNHLPEDLIDRLVQNEDFREQWQF